MFKLVPSILFQQEVQANENLVLLHTFCHEGFFEKDWGVWRHSMTKYLAYCVFGDNDLGLAMHDETCLLMGQNRKTKLKRISKKTEKLIKR